MLKAICKLSKIPKSKNPLNMLLIIACLGQCICVILQLFKVFRILKVDYDGIFFHIPFFQYFFYYFFFGEWTILFQNIFDDVTHDTHRISPFFQSIKAATNKDEARIFYKFVVSRGHMSFFIEYFTDKASYFTEVYRRAMPTDHEVSIIPDTTRADV